MHFLGFVLLCTTVFTGIILVLVAILSFIEVTVVKPGPCKLKINDKDPMDVHTGDNLLKSLSHTGIFLPAACGGEGKCGMCKCQVLEGGGDSLLTEAGHLTREQKKDHYRLACQVKIRGDIKVHVPDSVLNIKKFECTVRSNRNVATFIKEVVFEVPKGEPFHFEPGGYIQIDIPAYKQLSYKDFSIDSKFRSDWDKLKLWDINAHNPSPIFRAYSMASYPVENDIIMLNVRVATPPPNNPSAPAGIASSYIFNFKPGDKAILSGPFGEFHIKDTEHEMVYIGGGAGMAPMRSHIFHLFKTIKTKRKVTFWYGARSLKEIFYEEEFRAIEKDFPNFKFNIALSAAMPEDNWTGLTGFIHQVVEQQHIRKHDEPEGVEYYLCGPPVMVDAVEKMLYANGIPIEMVAFDKFG